MITNKPTYLPNHITPEISFALERHDYKTVAEYISKHPHDNHEVSDYILLLVEHILALHKDNHDLINLYINNIFNDPFLADITQDSYVYGYIEAFNSATDLKDMYGRQVGQVSLALAQTIRNIHYQHKEKHRYEVMLIVIKYLINLANNIYNDKINH